MLDFILFLWVEIYVLDFILFLWVELCNGFIYLFDTILLNGV